MHIYFTFGQEEQLPSAVSLLQQELKSLFLSTYPSIHVSHEGLVLPHKISENLGQPLLDKRKNTA